MPLRCSNLLIPRSSTAMLARLVSSDAGGASDVSWLIGTEAVCEWLLVVFEGLFEFEGCEANVGS